MLIPAAFPIEGGGHGGCPLHPVIFFEPPSHQSIKVHAPHGAPPIPLKNEAPPIEK